MQLGSTIKKDRGFELDYKDDNFWLMQGDCLDRMKEIPDSSVDMILCDLPYGTTACKWDTVIPFEPLWEQYKRIVKSNAAIVLTASQPFTSVLGVSNLTCLRYSWVWEKSRPTDFLNAKRKPLKGFEDILVFYQKYSKYNPQGVVPIDKLVKNTGTKGIGRGAKKANDDHSFHGSVTIDTYRQTVTGYPRGIIRFAQDSESHHPTQKPVALMEYLIKTYTNDGETVLDNTMGSGTTGVACSNLNRKFIGIEMDTGYFDIAKQRILNNNKGNEDAIARN